MTSRYSSSDESSISAAAQDAGVVDQDAQFAELPGRLLNQLRPVRLVGHIELAEHRLAAAIDDALGDSLSLCFQHVAEHDRSALAGEEAGLRLTLAASSA